MAIKLNEFSDEISRVSDVLCQGYKMEAKVCISLIS